MTPKVKNYIGGKWVVPATGAYSQSVNPADTEDVIACVPLSGKTDVDGAVSAARDAYEMWRLMPAPKRGEILFRAAEMLIQVKAELGSLISREMGKTLGEALGEVQEAADLGYYMAGEGRRLAGETVASELFDKDCKTIRVPIGVFALITPWNFPVSIPSWKIFAALACGNTVVLKPSSDSPYCAVRLVEIFEKAGVPAGVVNLLMGSGDQVGQPLALHSGVDGISFTGSCSTGELLERRASELHRPIAAQMGGKNAIIIMDDADLDLALEGVLWGAFATTGQRCTSASRVIVHQRVYDQFIGMLSKAVLKLNVGNGLEQGVEVGPLINERAMSKVLNYIRIGEEEGASLKCGGRRLTEGALRSGFFVEPSVFINVTPDMRIATEEIFGPVVSVMRCSSFDEGVKIANNNRFGLSTSIYTQNVNMAARFERDVESGLAYINASTIGAEIQLPFGGFKFSGSGRPEGGGRMGAVAFYSRNKTIFRDFSGRMQNPQTNDLP